MKQVILDTSFILTCLKQKIDFFDYLKNEGFNIIIPKQVITELEKISLPTQKSPSQQDLASLALRIIQNNVFDKTDLQISNLSMNRKSVDDLIINYAKQNPEIFVATLDKDIQKKTRNKKLIIRGRNQLEIK